ncbi:MAG: hypothetical protein HRF44_12415 [Ignavibacterium sp.]|jgi:hypothetical protein
MKSNRLTVRILAVTLVTIWGAIAYQIVTAVNTGDPEAMEVQTPVRTETPPAEAVVFDANVRNPFIIGVRPITRKKANASLPTPWVPPPLRLVGIVIKGRERMAVLEWPEGTTHFLAEGETLNGVKLLRILDREVEYQYQNKTKTLALN